MRGASRRQCSEAILTVKGVSRRIPWPRAPSRFLTVKGVNPKNTLAKSKAMLSMCPKSNHLLEFFPMPSGFLKYHLLYKYLSIFSICPNLLPGECFIILKSSLMKWCSVVFRVENCVHQFLHLVLRSFFNYQIFLCIKYHVSSHLFTLWNAYTSYELSSFLSRTQICEHFKDPTINTLKSKPCLFVKLLGYAILWEVSLEKGNI